MKVFHFVTFIIASASTLKWTHSQHIPISPQSSNQTTSNSKSVVYALPEIHIKFPNGTYHQAEANSPVVLSSDIKSIELTCTADYPVKWEYLIKNKTVPVLDGVYRRLIRNVSDFNNPKGNRFMALITLRGLLESQTGKYLCRHYNEKLDNNSYSVSSYFDIFVPGNKTFNTIPSVHFINKTAPSVSIYCPVTNPEIHVRLHKLNEKSYNKTGQLVWKPIYANYEPTHGFKLFAGLGREILGTYNCTADTGASVLYVVADLAEQNLYHSTFSSALLNSSCWENSKHVQYMRSKRLECYCRDSFGLFMNDDFEYENRQASCAMPEILERLENCSDWRLEEFFMNEEKSEEVCFRGRSALHINGSGSRPSLKVMGQIFANGDKHQMMPFTKFSITYNGLVDWAGDFMLAICRKDFCLQQRESRGTKIVNINDLEYLENEPTHRRFFPLAYHQAIWKDVVVSGTDVTSVYVFQAHSLSYAWFPYSTADIEWGNMRTEEDTQTSDQNMKTVNSSSHVLITSSNYYFLCILLALLILRNKM